MPGVAAARHMIPLPEFRAAVFAVASQATALAELAARNSASNPEVASEPAVGTGIPGFGGPVVPADVPADPGFPPISPKL